MKGKLNKNHFFWILAFFFSSLTAYFVFLTTTWGAGLTADSIFYITGARDILKTGNLTGLGSHWPPLYFILLAIGGAVTGDVLYAARWLQIILAFVSTALFGYILYRETQQTLCTAVLGWLIYVSSVNVLYMHSMAWSEALFCLLALVGFYFLSRHLQTKEGHASLLLASLFVGLAVITRYIGLALIVCGAFSILILSQRTVKERLFESILFTFAGSVFLLSWFVRNWVVKIDLTNRQLSYHPVPIEKIKYGIRVIDNWFFLPYSYSLISLIFLLVPLAVWLASTRYNKVRQYSPIFAVSYIFMAVYLVLLSLSLTYIDYATPLDERILYPVYLFYLISFFIFIKNLFHSSLSNNYLKISVIVLLSGFSLLQLNNQLQTINHKKENGIDFASKPIVQSDLLSWLKEQAEEKTVYTNGPDPIRLYLDRAAKMLPSHTFPGTNRRNYDIMNDIEEMTLDLIENDGFIIYFATITWRWYLPTIDQLKKSVPLKTVYTGGDGVVLKIDQQSLH